MDTVLVFDPKGKFVRSFGKEWHGGGHGIEIRKEGCDEFIYLSNTWTPDQKLVKTNLKGEVVWEKGRPECKEYEDPKTKPLQPDEHLLAARRRIQRRRRLRLELHAQLRQGRQAREGVRRRRQRARPARARRTASGSTPATRRSRCWSSATAPTPGSRRSTWTAQPIDGHEVAARSCSSRPTPRPAATCCSSRTCTPASAFRQGQQADRPSRRRRSWRKKVLDGFKVRRQPKEWVAGQVRPPARRRLRQGRQHLRGGVGRNGPRDALEEGCLAGERPGVSGPSLEVPKTRPAYAGPFAILPP